MTKSLVRKKWKKWTKGALGVVGMLVLSKIFDEVWLTWDFSVTKILLKLSTLGLTRLKDGMYQEVAKGLHEASSLGVYTIMITFIIVIAAVHFPLTIYLFHKRKGLKTRKELNHKFLSIIRKAVLNKIFLVIFVFYSVVFIGGVFSWELIRQNYVNEAVTHFNQLLTIVSPHLSDEQQVRIKSELSQIKTGEDYKIIINQLQAVADENQQKTPSFDIF